MKTLLLGTMLWVLYSIALYYTIEDWQERSMQMKKIKKIPYGTASYDKIQEFNHYFVDKTKYLEILENLDTYHLFFLRPRRFGKSLWLSILEHYYDVNKKDRFEELFGDTYIGKNPTPLRNTYPILKLNFSGIPTDGKSEKIKTSFDLRIRISIESFYFSYPQLCKNFNFKEDYQNTIDSTDMLAKFLSMMSLNNIKFYLLIDEYDNFANNILIHHGKERYQRVTHQAGFLRSFFAAVKNGTESGAIARMFVTGVSPLVLSDVTSGMNIGDNISNKVIFNSMIGFTQNEVEEMLDYYIDAEVVKKEERSEIIELMQYNYNNYCFSENVDEKVYNSDMILYFFNNYSQEKKIPSNLIDENVRIDYGKLRY
ncbi:MAG: AAA family ATPase, partial [Candidatus Fermentibacteraceae bacterium]|nr:AAA family ATPase [Candidatus Fermentibacteraceae bacterium]